MAEEMKGAAADIAEAADTADDTEAADTDEAAIAADDTEAADTDEAAIAADNTEAADTDEAAGKAGLNRNRVLISVILVLALALAAYSAYRVVSHIRSTNRAERILEQMYSVVPGLGTDSGISTGAGREQLAAVSIDGVDIVGCLEIPALDLMVPVTAGGSETQGLAAYVSGSPVSGKLRLRGDSKDLFRELEVLKPGETVAFTDMDGFRYRYTVTTQYHLREWDEGDNDLLLGREAGSDSEFIVGCAASW